MSPFAQSVEEPMVSPSIQTLLSSFTLVVTSEMGDKTQLLAFALATRFKRPWTIMAGILVATLVNHGLASWSGAWIAAHIPARTLNVVLAAVFIGFGAWILVPDQDEDDDREPRFGAFLTTAVSFFFAEMGDKTQLATIALGARFQSVALVTTGTTLGMLAADGLAVFLGERLSEKISMTWIRRAAAALFIAFGVALIVRH